MTVARFRIFAAYAACVLIWGTTWLAIKFSLIGLPPVTGAGIRFIVAAALLYASAIVTRVDLRGNPPPVHLVLVLAATMFGLNYTLTYLAETHLASGLVAVLFGTMPFFIFGFARAMVGEHADWKTIAGALLALVGVAVISLVGNVRGDVLYVLAAVAASASSGFANVYLKKFAACEPLAVLPPAMLIAGLAMAAFGIPLEHPNWAAAATPGTIVAVLYLAGCGSALAFTLNHWLLQRIDSGVMGLSALMIPVIAVAVGALYGHESLGPRDLFGALLVLAGVCFSLARPHRPGTLDIDAEAHLAV